MAEQEAHTQCLVGHIAIVAAAERQVSGLVEFAPSSTSRHKNVLHCAGCAISLMLLSQNYCFLLSALKYLELCRPLSAKSAIATCRTALEELPSRATKGNVTSTLCKLVCARRCHVQGAVLWCSPGPDVRCHVRLDLYLNSDVLTDALPWEPLRIAGEIFSHVIPATHNTMHDALVCPLCAHHSQAGVPQELTCCLCSRERQEEAHTYETPDTSDAVISDRWELTDDEQWNLSAEDLRARVQDSLAAPDKSESNTAPFNLHTCFEQLPNWLVVASEYPPLPPPKPGTATSSVTSNTWRCTGGMHP